MAFDFVKKMFSFGRKAEEVAPAAAPAPAPAETRTPPVAVAPEEIAPAIPEPARTTTEPLPAEPQHVPGEPAPVPTEAKTPLAEATGPVPAPAAEGIATAGAAELQPPEPAHARAEPAPAPKILLVPSVETPAPAEVPPVEAEKPAASPLEIPPPVPDVLPAPRVDTQVPAEVPPVERDQPEAAPPEALVPTAPTPPVAAPAVEGPPPTVPAPASPAAPAGKVTVSKAVERKAEPVPAPAAPPRQGWFQRMRTGLSRSSKELGDNIAGLFTKARLTEEIIEDLEEVLLRADLGMETAIRITGALESGRYGRQTTEADVRAVMAGEIEKVLAPVALPLELDLSHKPHVILVVGVNGTGKTTTIGKLAAKLTAGGLSVTLAAGDTFRAAAIEQLKIWGERTGSPVVSSKLGADAAGLAFEGFQKAKEAGSDVLIIDTAGRLQNKAELMAELEKIVRVLGKLDPEAPHTVLQTVDATTGQNAMNQVEIFRNVAGVNGLVMTKLDGTARGGILVAIAAKHRLPVYFIGVGEQVDDLEPFSAREFARAIAGVA